MTLTRTITDELLDSVGETGGLDEVLRRRSRSKGPLYAALSDATMELTQRLELLHDHIQEADVHSSELDEEIERSNEFRDGLIEQIDGLERQVKDNESRLEDVDGVLSKADDLTRRGFGEMELFRLHEMLVQFAARAGALPEESIAQFFETVTRYESIVSFDLEITRSEALAAQAKAEADRCESEARLVEANSKARTSTIKFAEHLIEQGVKAQDLPDWQRILDTAKTTPEEFALLLESFGSVESLTKDRENRAVELQIQVSKLEKQNTALTKERDGIHAAVQALREESLNEVKAAGQQLSREIKKLSAQAREYVEGIAQLGAQYGNLRDEAAVLREYVDVARNLRSDKAEDWQRLPRNIVQNLLMGILYWTQADGRNVETPAPAAIHARSTMPSYVRLRLGDVPIWSLTGIISEEERKALTIRY